MLEIIGYIAAIGMGLSLGLIGGGGSILTVPILVYLFHIDPVLATAYSLFIVGATSLFGSFSHIKLGNIHWRTAFVFGVPSIISVFLTRMYLVPAIPNPIFTVAGHEVSKATGLLGAGGGFLIIPALVLLAKLPMKKSVGTSLMIIAAKSLIGFMGDLRGDEVIDWKFMLIFTAIAVVGIFTGSYMSSKISNDKLKPVFGWFVLVMGVYILLKETVLK